MYNKIAVIGDKDSVLAFKSVGVEVFDATTAEQAQNLIKKLSQRDYAVRSKSPTLLPRLSLNRSPRWCLFLPTPTAAGSACRA